MTDGMLDLLAMVLVMAVVLSIGFGLILPLIDMDLMKYDEVIQDKSMLNIVKDATDADIAAVTGNMDIVPAEPLMTDREVILMSQVQDVSMPQPRKFLVNGTTIEVTSTYKLAMRQAGLVMWNTLPNKPANYTVNYSYVSPTVIGDEAYEIKVK